MLLDTSGSTLGQSALSEALGAVEGLFRHAYLHRERIALLSFGNNQVKTLLSPRRAPKHKHPLVQKIAAGGGTPLNKAIQATLRLVKDTARRFPGEHQQVYIFTDGRSRDSLAGLPAAQAFADLTIIDTERTAVRLGRAKRLARQLDAAYVPIDSLPLQ